MSKKFIRENKNKTLMMNGLELLSSLPDNSVDASFFDPQYREVLDYSKLGNEGARQKKRALLAQMSTHLIQDFCVEQARVLRPSGYMFLWVDKFILCEGIHKTFTNTGYAKDLKLVDMITWDKGTFGMGRRSRRTNENLIIYQKLPATIASWSDKGIRDTWSEKVPEPRKGHPHKKPLGLVSRLIKCVVGDKGIVLDPCAGSFGTFVASRAVSVDFIGCDLTLEYVDESFLDAN